MLPRLSVCSSSLDVRFSSLCLSPYSFKVDSEFSSKRKKKERKTISNIYCAFFFFFRKAKTVPEVLDRLFLFSSVGKIRPFDFVMSGKKKEDLLSPVRILPLELVRLPLHSSTPNQAATAP